MRITNTFPTFNLPDALRHTVVGADVGLNSARALEQRRQRDRLMSCCGQQSPLSADGKAVHDVGDLCEDRRLHPRAAPARTILVFERMDSPGGKRKTNPLNPLLK